MSFTNFAFNDQIMKNLERLQFHTPTPIQAKAIPVVLEGRDVIGSAQTGTGKTAAFALPTIDYLIKNPDKTAVILAPTRELAMQIFEVIRDFTKDIPNCGAALFIGGLSMQNQIKSLRRDPRILVATPGRLVDHLHRQSVELNNVGILVLDEADRMLDMGFAPQLQVIRRFLPEIRQTLLFSATFPKEIMALANSYLKDPVKIEVGAPQRPVQKIMQRIIETTVQKKNDLLLDLLNAKTGPALIFVRTKHRTDRLHTFLEEYGYPVARIHGGRSQGQRTLALRGFRDGEYRILVATDIAARGIDVENIEMVVNYDLPDVPEDYVHRIGRTARNGQAGHAICLLTPEDKEKWYNITRFIERKEGRAQPNLHSSHHKKQQSQEQRHSGYKRFSQDDKRQDKRHDGRHDNRNENRNEKTGRPHKKRGPFKSKKSFKHRGGGSKPASQPTW